MRKTGVIVALVLVVALTIACGTVTTSGRPNVIASPATATLWTPSTGGSPGETFYVTGSGFAPSTSVDLYIAGDLWTTVSTSEAGTFMAMHEAPSLPVETVYAIEAFIGDELWATHPYVTGQ